MTGVQTCALPILQWRGAHWDARLAKGQASQNGQATYIISAREGNLLWIEQFSER